MFKKYISFHITEYLLIVIASLGFCVNIFSSFKMSESVTENYPLTTFIVAVVAALMFLFGYSKRNTFIGIFAVVTTLVSGFAVFRAMGYFSVQTEAERSPVIYAAIVFLTPILTYLMTRTVKLNFLYIPICTISCAAFAFLRYPVKVWAFIIMVFALLFLVLYKVYLNSVMNASYGSFNLKNFTLQSLAIVLSVIVLGSGIYYGVVRPLDPDTKELKLITKLLSFDVLEKIGVSSTREVESPDIKSNKLNDQNRNTNNKDENKGDVKDEDKTDDDNKAEQETEKEENDTKPRESENFIEAMAINYSEISYLKYIVIGLVAFLLILPVVIKRIVLRRRKTKIESMNSYDGIVYLYNYFLKAFGKLDIAKEATITINEYIEHNKESLMKFNSLNGTSFETLSDIYSKSIYGLYEPTDDDYKMFKDFYLDFRRNVKNVSGKLKYYAVLYWKI